MMPGARSGRFAAIAILLAAGLAGPTAARAAPDPAVAHGGTGVDSLMLRLRQVKSASAHFVEHKSLHILTQHIDCAGTLAYVAPGRLEKRTTSPYPETMVLDGDLLSGEARNGRHFSLNLSNHREVAALVEGVRSTLAGDLATLQRYYRVTYAGTAGNWRLTLVPIDAAVRGKLDWICLHGSASVIREIDFRQANGDHSEMVITPDAP